MPTLTELVQRARDGYTLPNGKQVAPASYRDMERRTMRAAKGPSSEYTITHPQLRAYGENIARKPPSDRLIKALAIALSSDVHQVTEEEVAAAVVDQWFGHLLPKTTDTPNGRRTVLLPEGITAEQEAAIHAMIDAMKRR